MTENEKAIEQLERISKNLGSIGETEDYTEVAIQALEEVQQYRETGHTPTMVRNLIRGYKAEHKQNMKIVNELEDYQEIGTVEECRSAVEKQTAKKPTPIDYEKYMGVIENAKFLRGAYWCPNCNHVVKSGTFCSNCGQKLDWRDDDGKTD